jgi:hypothetical protein
MEWVLFAHVVVGTIWLGGVMYQEALTAGAKRVSRDEYVRTSVRAQAVNGRIYPVVTILILATAIWMIAAREELGWGDIWISLSFGIWVIAVATGIGYFTPKAKIMETQLAAEGPSDDLYDLVTKVHRIARIEVIVLLGLAFLMIFQPGG